MVYWDFGYGFSKGSVFFCLLFVLLFSFIVIQRNNLINTCEIDYSMKSRSYFIVWLSSYETTDYQEYT